MDSILSEQKTFFRSGKTLNVNYRIAALKKLRNFILQYEREILQALKNDLGKSELEAYVTEVGFIYTEIGEVIRKLKQWVKPLKPEFSLSQIFSKVRIHPEPYGTVFILSPWNYPFNLTLSPLIGAIAGGNTAVIRPSQNSPSTSGVLKQLIDECFPKEYVAVIMGDTTLVDCLIEEKPDYLFFTGSVSVGKSIMEKAAKHLIPVTLELGGKSPCIIDSTADLDQAVKRIVWGKLTNCGQTCVAPDYFLVEEAIKEKFVAKVIKTIKEFYGSDPLSSQDYPKMVNQKQFTRVLQAIQTSGGKLLYGGTKSEKTLQISPTIIDTPNLDSALMQEEIFGPVFPFVPYQTFGQAIHFIQTREKPLACYLFSTDKKRQNELIRRVSFGGGCINHTLIHLSTSKIPFGGVGSSGMGQYHGRYSFDTFTHKKSIFYSHPKLGVDFLFPPFHPAKLGWLKKMMK